MTTAQAISEPKTVTATRKRSRKFPFVPWLMLSPAIILIVGFVAYPAVNALVMSTTDATIFTQGAAKFVGLDNYKEVFSSEDFPIAFRNSLIWTFGNVACQLLFGMIGALLLNQRMRGRAIARGLVLLPWATPSVLIALMWLWILDPNLGIFNAILSWVTGSQIDVAWLATQDTALPTLMFIDIWQGVPFFAVMILAALQGVPAELHEAAKIDGASTWQAFWRVTFPLILPTILITTILRLIWTSNYFDLMLVLTGGGPGTSTLTIPLSAYITAYRGSDFGTASALATVQAALMMVLIVFYIRQVRKSEIA
jgi:ABC-type sugar transport systems, permease components